MAIRISEPTRERLKGLLSTATLDGPELLARLRQMRRLEGADTCAAMLELMTHLAVPETDAEQLLVELQAHRQSVARSLGRDPGLRVAAVDYLSNVKSVLRNPAIVELDELESIERAAGLDVVTSLVDRRCFDATLRQETRRVERVGSPLSLLRMDLDRFRQLIERHGSSFGDSVLRRVGAVVRDAIRDADVGARLHSAGFAVILPQTACAGAICVAERLRERVATTFQQSFQDVRTGLTGSVAVAEYVATFESIPQLIQRLERAVVRAQEQRGNRVALAADAPAERS